MKRGNDMTKKPPKILQDFLIYLTTIRGKSKQTRKEYQYDIMMLFRFLWCMREDLEISNTNDVDVSKIDIDFIKDISLEDLYLFIEYCEVQRKNSASARARKVASIKSFFKYLLTKRRLIEFNPAEELETPKIGKRNPIYLTLKEAEMFIDGVKDGKHYYRNNCLITLLLHLGLRVSELCNLNLNSIQETRLTVVGKGDKERIIPLNTTCIEAINDYKNYERKHLKNNQDNEALFLSQLGTRLNKRTVQRIVKGINTSSGLNKDKITPHKLRHTSATLLYKEKPDIRSLQYFLGHESVSTTQIYTHIDSNELMDLVSMNPLNQKIK